MAWTWKSASATELVNHLAGTFFSACFGFWRWLERQKALNALLEDPEEEQQGEGDPEPEEE